MGPGLGMHRSGARAGGWTALAVVVALLLPVAGRAEWIVDNDSPASIFLKRTYVFASPNRIHRLGDPRSPAHLFFEAQLAPHFFLPQFHHGGFREPGGEFFFTAVLTPAIQIRLLDTASRPVIPPSYLPQLTLQVAHLRLLPGSAREGSPLRGLALAANLVAGHHSNGEDGCFFANQTGTDPDCVPAEGSLPLNEVTGSFSTNFLRGELYVLLAFDVEQDLDSAWLVGGGSFLELNSSLGIGGLTSEERRVYGDGFWGFSVQARRIWHRHRFLFEGTLSRPFGEEPHRRTTLSAELSALPWWGAGFGLFTRYVHGQDSYNILFLERLSQWQFGVVFELPPGARLREEAKTSGPKRRLPGFR
ncbi:hypothetical protein LY474_01440 [Myxococcus stipitatus]|uniref:hypothetical protein n=1 Tax=Myxococcus stipitatus TaxID=83455 RepID=UPI001F319BF5|nr:hypothetical protein [Myxococcus stipitatus]MCE9666462.1 hypothetical protein [Myxococcus stipitatus]